MANKAKEVIQLRNEGMAYALKIANEHGIDALRQEVKRRGYYRATVKFTPEEMSETLNEIQDRCYYNLLAVIYGVLHEDFKFGSVRLKRFKELYEKKVHLIGDPDPLGRRYVRFEDYADEANKKCGFGIDLEMIRDSEMNYASEQRTYVALDSVLKVLEEEKMWESADLIRARTDDPEKKELLTETDRKRAERRQQCDRKNKYYTDSLYEQNIEYWFNVFGLALQKLGCASEEVPKLWSNADTINGLLASGDKTLRDIKEELFKKSGFVCEFTK